MFDFFKPQLVQFSDGKFSVRLRIPNFLWVGFTTYCIGKDGGLWCIDYYIDKYAKFATEEEAIDAYFTYKSINIKPKIISTLDEWDVL